MHSLCLQLKLQTDDVKPMNAKPEETTVITLYSTIARKVSNSFVLFQDDFIPVF